MRHWTLSRGRWVGLLIACFAVTSTVVVRAQANAADSAHETNVTYSGFPILEGTRVKRIEFPEVGVRVPQGAQQFTVTTVIQLDELSPTTAGLRAVNGRVDIDYTCFGTTLEQGTARTKIKDGNAVYSDTMAQTNNCNFFQQAATGRGGATTPLDANGSIMLSVTPFDPASSCVPDSKTLCLQDSRFQVNARRRVGGKNVAASAFPTANGEGTFFFFDPNNTELVVKVLDRCGVAGFDSFWVYAGGLTDVEVTLTVTDTQTGQVKQYGNDLGTPFAPVRDTSAFLTCP